MTKINLCFRQVKKITRIDQSECNVQEVAGKTEAAVKKDAEKLEFKTDFSEGLFKAAKSGDFDYIKNFKFYYEIPKKSIEIAVFYAASKGHLNIIDFLLNIDINNYEAALVIAASEGHLNIVRFLWNYYKGTKEKEISFIATIFEAALKNRFNVIDFLFSANQTLFKHSLNEAASKGYLNIVKNLIKGGKISPLIIGEALECAASNNHLDVVEFLIEANEKFLKALNSNSNLDYINSCKLANETLFKLALNKAASKGHLDVVKVLIKGDKISPLMIETALECAASKGRLDVVKVLIENNEISFSVFCWSVWSAASNNHLNVVNFLIEVNEKFLRSLNSNSNLVYINRYRLANEIFFKWALTGAASNGHLDIINFLIKDRDISESNIEYALISAAREGHLNLVERLFNREKTSLSCIGCAVKAAVINDHFEIVKFLLLDDTIIDQDDLGSAVMGAALKGNSDIVNILLSNSRTLKPKDVKELIIKVYLMGNAKILNILLEKRCSCIESIDVLD